MAELSKLSAQLICRMVGRIRDSPGASETPFFAALAAHPDTSLFFGTVNAALSRAPVFTGLLEDVATDWALACWTAFCRTERVDLGTLLAQYHGELGDAVVATRERAQAFTSNFEALIEAHFPSAWDWAATCEARAQAADGRASFTAQLEAAPPFGLPSRPGWLAVTDFRRRLTPLFGRDALMDALADFRDGDQSFRWWSIYGPKGCGKSRLALAWLEASLAAGWLPVYLGEGYRRHTFSEWRPFHPTVIVVENASAHEHLQRLHGHRTQCGLNGDPRVRILYLDRAEARPGWPAMFDQNSRVHYGQSKDGNGYREPLLLGSLHSNKGFFDVAVAALGAEPCDQPYDRAALHRFLQKRPSPLWVLATAQLWASNAHDRGLFKMSQEAALAAGLQLELARVKRCLNDETAYAAWFCAVVWQGLAPGGCLEDLQKFLFWLGANLAPDQWTAVRKLLVGEANEAGFTAPLGLVAPEFLWGGLYQSNTLPGVKPFVAARPLEITSWLVRIAADHIGDLTQPLRSLAKRTRERWLEALFRAAGPGDAGQAEDWWMQARTLLAWAFIDRDNVEGAGVFIERYAAAATQWPSVAMNLALAFDFLGRGDREDRLQTRRWYTLAVPDSDLRRRCGDGADPPNWPALEQEMRSRHIWYDQQPCTVDPIAFYALVYSLSRQMDGESDLSENGFWCERAGLSGLPYAMFLRADWRRYSGDVQIQSARRRWFGYAHQAGSPEGAVHLALMLASEYGGPKYSARSRALLEAEVAKGNLEAMGFFAEMLAHGFWNQRPSAIDAIIPYRQQASTLEDHEALFRLGWLLRSGAVVENQELAVFYLKAAVFQGNKAAIRPFVQSWDWEDSSSDEAALSRKALDLAAKAGDRKLMLTYARYLLEGIGGKEDPAAARHWLAESASLGLAEAQSWLGEMYMAGIGGERDPEMARVYFEQAQRGGFGVGFYGYARRLVMQGDYDQAMVTLFRVARTPYYHDIDDLCTDFPALADHPERSRLAALIREGRESSW